MQMITLGSRCNTIYLRMTIRRSDVLHNNLLHKEIAQKLENVTSLPGDNYWFELHPHGPHNYVSKVVYSPIQHFMRGKCEKCDVNSG
jgi:hypothetical protein